MDRPFSLINLPMVQKHQARPILYDLDLQFKHRPNNVYRRMELKCHIWNVKNADISPFGKDMNFISIVENVTSEIIIQYLSDTRRKRNE